MSTQPPLCLRDLGQHFHKPNPTNHISLFPEGCRLLQDHHSFRILALPWLSFSFILSLLVFFFFLNSSWKWKYSATHIQKASLWMEAAFATETSVSHGNNTTKLFKMLCWCFCSPQPLGAGRSWAECFGYVTVIASRLGESMGDSFSIACLSDTRKYNSLASVFMTAGFVLPWTSQLPH